MNMSLDNLRYRNHHLPMLLSSVKTPRVSSPPNSVSLIDSCSCVAMCQLRIELLLRDWHCCSPRRTIELLGSCADASEARHGYRDFLIRTYRRKSRIQTIDLPKCSISGVQLPADTATDQDLTRFAGRDFWLGDQPDDRSGENGG